MTRDIAIPYPPVYLNYSAMEIGDNVKWYQNNYGSFISDKGTPNLKRDIVFGKHNRIEALNSEHESIDLKGTNHILNFNEGSTIKLTGKDNIISVSGGTKVTIDSPTSLDLLTTNKTSNVLVIGSFTDINISNIKMNVWNENAIINGDPTKRFDKVNLVNFTRSEVGGIRATSDNPEIAEFFKVNKIKRITSEKIEVGDVAIQFINQNMNKVGNPIILDIDKESVYVGAQVTIPESVYEQIPNGYHYATQNELDKLRKTQPKYALVGEKDIDDPMITEVYIYGDNIKSTLNYITTDGDIISSEVVNVEQGTVIDFSTEEYKDKINVPYVYAQESDLKLGQVQPKETTIEKDGVYNIYVVLNEVIKVSREEAIEALNRAAQERIDAINSVINAKAEGVETATNKVKSELDKAIDKVKNADSENDVVKERDQGIKLINAITIKKHSVSKPKTPVTGISNNSTLTYIGLFIIAVFGLLQSLKRKKRVEY